jgi:hypothetical protein
MSPSRFDDFARNIAPPMSRRQTLRAAAGLALAAFLPAVRPGFAAGAPEQDCAGRNELCPTPGSTNCGHSTPGQVGACCCYCCASADQCMCSGSRCFCCPNKCGDKCCNPGETCKNGQCFTCPADRVCGATCCNPGEYCETRFLGEDTCEKLCPHTHTHMCVGVCCTENETCGFFGCKCKSGFVSTGAGTCVPPKDDPGDPPVSDNWLTRMGNMISQTSASHGGSSHRALFARPSTSGSAAVDAALDALAAVNGQGAAATLAIPYGKRDPAFKRKVTAARATPPTLSTGPGLDAGSVAALNTLLRAEARANALIAAMAKTLWRARAAHAKHDRAAARRQLRASATFAAQAATALKTIQALRTAAANALTAGGVAEVIASEAAVTAFLATVATSGIPATLSTPMGKLGVGSADLKNLRARVLDQTVSSGSGPALIAPLTDPARVNALKNLITQMSQFSARARKHPIAH